jgi:hypothetical protein
LKCGGFRGPGVHAMPPIVASSNASPDRPSDLRPADLVQSCGLRAVSRQ